MTKTFMSLFSGGGLADVGAKAAGFALIAANEYDQRIAEVYRANHGDHIRVGNILEQDPYTYPRPDLLHASPVCTSFSMANTKRGEQALDIACARKTAEFISMLRPQSVTIENVPQYQTSESFKIICDALNRSGYWYDVRVLNAADFGVPQTRKRLFVRAELGAFVNPLPSATVWQGWYEAIEDLLPSLPDSEFAKWQIPYLPKSFSDGFILGNGTRSLPRKSSEPTEMITGNTNQNYIKAFITNGQKFGDKWTWDSEEPSPTIRHRIDHYRAYVVDGQNSGYGPAVVSGENRIFTTTSSIYKGMPRAYVGRVVMMTPRAIARFQSAPDSFILPDGKSAKTLSAKIIGNGVPCRMYEAIARCSGAAQA